MLHSRRCSFLLPTALAWVAGLATPSSAAPPDRDYETVAPTTRPPVPLPASPAITPPGFAGSPLVIPPRPSGGYPRRRFVLRDGGVLVGQILGFDGLMYALRLPHETVLLRRDLIAAVTPVRQAGARPASNRSARRAQTRAGARY